MFLLLSNPNKLFYEDDIGFIYVFFIKDDPIKIIQLKIIIYLI